MYDSDKIVKLFNYTYDYIKSVDFSFSSKDVDVMSDFVYVINSHNNFMHCYSNCFDIKFNYDFTLTNDCIYLIDLFIDLSACLLSSWELSFYILYNIESYIVKIVNVLNYINCHE